MSIAEVLRRRAERLLGEALTTTDAIHAAVLALEAKELLGERTPTTALEILSLQHEAEVTAESMFVGVEYSISVRDRFHEVQDSVDQASHWFAKHRRIRSALNARLVIAERLAKRFRGLSQIEEELACLSEARHLRFEFWMRERPWRRIAWPILRYLDFALSSLPHFATALFSSVIFFGLLYFVIDRLAPTGAPRSLLDAFGASALYFFTLQPADGWNSLAQPRSDWNVFWNFILAFQGLISFTNLGLFMSHVFLIVSRR